MNSAYWNSKLEYYMVNQPPKADSYYNQSFVDKMNEARQNIDNLVAEKDKSWGAVQQKQDEVNTFNGQVSDYRQIYNQAQSEFGVTEHQDNYEKSKKALALAESTLNALPSSINANSNQVLTQAQREQAYNLAADRIMSYQSNLMARTSAYEEVWKQAKKNQADYAQAEIASQYKKLGDFNNAYVQAINDFTTAQQKLLGGKIELQQWERGYRSWQNQQYQAANYEWLNNLNFALDRYVDALNTDMVALETNYQKQQQLRDAENKALKNTLAGTLVNSYVSGLANKQRAAVADTGGIAGKAAYLINTR